MGHIMQAASLLGVHAEDAAGTQCCELGENGHGEELLAVQVVHGRHSTAPATDEYFPAGQSLHAIMLMSLASRNIPGGHLVHMTSWVSLPACELEKCVMDVNDCYPVFTSYMLDHNFSGKELHSYPLVMT
jgi:hypothetical protein